MYAHAPDTVLRVFSLKNSCNVVEAQLYVWMQHVHVPQAAARDNPGFIYIDAALDTQQFEALLGQTAAAAQCASKAAAAAEAAKAQVRDVYTQ